jgi:cytochrome b561
MERQNISEVLRRPGREGVKYGSIAGLIATWSISTAIAASELELGLPISTFYSIIGISLGSNDFVASAYLGFGLHLVTGTILGAISGGLAVKVELRKNITSIFDPYKSILMGIATGILVWLILFLPITAFIIQPSIGRIIEILSLRPESTVLSVFDSNNLGQSFRGIGISAIAFHVVWGAIFGFIISSLLRIRLSSLSLSSASSFMKRNPQFTGSPLRTVYFGLVAGLISSLAISGLILLVEKINSLPVGTFYYVLVSALTNSYSSNTETVIAIGLAAHLLAGSFLGLVMSIPFIILRNLRGGANNRIITFIEKYTSVYGIAFGFGLWLVVFLPITFTIVIPLLNSFEFQDIIIRQRVPTGEVTSATFYGLLSMMDRIIYGAIALNIFYGLVTAIMLQSFSKKYPVTDNKHERQNEADLIRGRDGE